MENENLESLCTRCGLCCHLKIGLLDGSFVVHPFIVCKHLTEDNLCGIYDERTEAMEQNYCFKLEDMIKKDYILAEGCPYIRLRQDYKAAKVVSEDDFHNMTLEEILKGNFNLLKIVDDILNDPNAKHKMIDKKKNK
ncbi:MAG: hypothetical protein AB1442_11455 [Nitrospirota bacterium]